MGIRQVKGFKIVATVGCNNLSFIPSTSRHGKSKPILLTVELDTSEFNPTIIVNKEPNKYIDKPRYNYKKR